jgi:outer membrane protein OmpA-like peptidoglycan-associated protein
VDARAVAAEPATNAAVARSSLSAAVKDSIGSEFVHHAARVIGANEWRTQSATDLLVSAVLRRLARRSATPDGAARVFAELGSPRIDSDYFATVDRLLADESGEHGGSADVGREAAEGLLGRETRALVLNVAATSGLTVDATWQLLTLAIPLVYAALRDHVRDRGLDAEALQNRFATEYVKIPGKRRFRLRPTVAAATGQALRFAREARTRAAAALARRDRRAVRGVLALAAVVAVALWLSGGGPTTEVVSSGGERPTRLVEDATDPMPGARHSAGLDGLIAFLSNSAPETEYVFALDGVQFEPASATLRSASNAQLAQLARVLTDFPEARLTIEAYDDGAPDGAQGDTRSERRALAVRAAIAALGVQPSRMRHAGVNGASRAGPLVEARVTKE